MNWTLQLIEVVVLLAMGAAAHLVTMRARRAFVVDLEALAGKTAWAITTISDVIVGLVYVAFVSAVAPPEVEPWAQPYHLEDVLDVLALGALVLAFLEVTALLTIHRIAQHLEPWPPKPVPQV